MGLNKTKLEEYANKVYRGDLRRFKEKQKKDNSFTFDLFFTQESKATKGKRVAPSSSQGIVVVDKYNRKCAICDKKYDKDPGDFEIHHINGDRSKARIDNFVLLCLSCHKKVHTHARVELKEHKDRIKDRRPKNTQPQIGFPKFEAPTFDLPSFDSPFDLGSKKKSRKKKGK